MIYISSFFFFNDTATTEIYTLSLHDALPICDRPPRRALCADLRPVPAAPRLRARRLVFALSPLLGLGACVAAHVIVSRLRPAWPRARGVIVSVLEIGRAHV